MGKILKKTVEQTIYVSKDGRETVLTEMADPHLVNAFGQACENSKDPMPVLSWTQPKSDNDQLVKALRNEILRRLSLCKSNNEK